MLDNYANRSWKKQVPPLELDNEPDFLAFVQTVLDAHMAEVTGSGGYSIEKGDEEARVQSVVAATFLTSFGLSPADRYSDIFDQAASFAYYLVRDHPFGDGNKRTAIRIALAMIALRNVTLEIGDSPNPWQNELYRWIESLVAGSLTQEGLAAHLRERAHL